VMITDSLLRRLRFYVIGDIEDIGFSRVKAFAHTGVAEESADIELVRQPQ